MLMNSSHLIDMKTEIIITFAVDGMHNFPAAKKLFPEVFFLSDPHRHMFHFKVYKEVYHDDRDIEFIMFKRTVMNYLHTKYYSIHLRTLEFGAQSCEMLAKEILTKFDCTQVEVWEDAENGARVTK